jgi:hypothetical protein
MSPWIIAVPRRIRRDKTLRTSLPFNLVTQSMWISKSLVADGTKALTCLTGVTPRMLWSSSILTGMEILVAIRSPGDPMLHTLERSIESVANTYLEVLLMFGTPTRSGSLEKTNFLMTLAWFSLPWT